MNRLLTIVVVLLTMTMLGRGAWAANPTKAQCISANEKADSLRKSGSLRDARASLLVCANPACPRLVRNDCNLHIPDVDAATPTITFTAKNGADDTTAVTIAMDGEPIAKEADGKPVNVDPGEHTFTFALTGSPSQTQKLVIREGEKNRKVLIQFGGAPSENPVGRLVVTSSPSAAIAVDGRSTVMGRFDGPVAAGSHDVKVSENGKITITRIVEVKKDATETLSLALEPEKRSLVPWIVGGAVLVTVALVVGGIFLFSSSDSKSSRPPQGSLGGVGLASFR